MAAKLLDPIPPGEILYEEFMKPLGVSINALARAIAVPPNRISEIVGGNAITADTARVSARFRRDAELGPTQAIKICAGRNAPPG
jgi:addiction module HigA family antidote